MSIFSIIKIGHRGAMGYELENTISGFAKAIELNVDYIELDIWSCKTGELVVMHDKTLDRTTLAKGSVKSFTLNQLRKIKSKNSDPISTFNDVLNFINRRCKVIVEIKDNDVIPELARTLNEFINVQGWTFQDFIVTSFDSDDIKKFKKMIPQIATGILYVKPEPDYLTNVKKLKCDIIAIDKKYLTKELVEKVHNNLLKIFIYTVNKISDIHKVKSFGVDGIISDFPDRISF